MCIVFHLDTDYNSFDFDLIVAENLELMSFRDTGLPFRELSLLGEALSCTMAKEQEVESIYSRVYLTNSMH